MNANELSLESNVRSNRIKKVSRIARFVVLAILLFYSALFIAVIFSGFPISLPSRIPSENRGSPDWFLIALKIVTAAYQIVLCIWYWKLAQLFRLYERGIIFGVQTIRCIKSLGLLCVIGGFLLSTSAVMAHSALGNLGRHGLIPKSASTPPAVVASTIIHYRTGFFSADFGTGIDFGLVFAGVVIVLVAWIMDEGRKIQEEQELTV